ncbi:hypothetical protein TWF225_000728 [Orbilia oligospora]|uniref:Uncharacterized protein n=1 Tax=Orbilia oligospora TaxID=2813651 RepID=A0A7C8TYL1_ORBOL|nr:hypothetical protein TWF225_000728 [Orbilia oligospora]KAF3182903.1 hypothetical protein TWF751_006092 [Orbilia oligospora]KAF3244810.1 hypothetical protein TWF217_010647 [Orbilia oligospora]KAF3246991.1 hypothetical protein TWF128_008755 [Orbilia oligospora]TGJ71664.1 hypothetical protein EYR41_003614 [Orbilia oligospora]
MEPPGLESYPGPRGQPSHFPSSPLRVRHVDSCMKLAYIWFISSILSTRATLAIGGEVSKLEPISTSTRPAQRVSGGSWISQSWKESVRVLKSRGQAYRTRNSCRIGEYRCFLSQVYAGLLWILSKYFGMHDQCHFCTICFDELFSGDQTRDTTGHLVLQFEVAYYFYGIGKPFETPSEMTSRSGFLPILRVSRRNQILEGSE